MIFISWTRSSFSLWAAFSWTTNKNITKTQECKNMATVVSIRQGVVGNYVPRMGSIWILALNTLQFGLSCRKHISICSDWFWLVEPGLSQTTCWVERFSDWLAVSWLLLRMVSRSTFSIALKSDRLNGRQVIMGEQVLAEIGSVWALLHASPPAPCIMIFISSLAITIAMYVQWICGGEQSSF